MNSRFIAVFAFSLGVIIRDQAEEWRKAPVAQVEPPPEITTVLLHPIPYDATVCQEKCRFYIRSSKEEQ